MLNQSKDTHNKLKMSDIQKIRKSTMNYIRKNEIHLEHTCMSIIVERGTKLD